MKLTEKMLKQQIEKTLNEARTFDQFMKGDGDADYTDTDILDARDQKKLAAEEEEVERLRRLYQSAEDREQELFMQGEEDAQTVVVRSPRTFKRPQHSSQAYMAGYASGQLKQKKKDAAERVANRERDKRERERALKRTGLATPNSDIQEVWNFMMSGGGEITANTNNSMFRDGWLPFLRAKHGKRWTRTPTSELRKEWEQGLIDGWKNQYGNMKAIKDLQLFLRNDKIRHKRLKTKDQQWWVNELSTMGQQVVDKIFKKHKSGMMGKAASFLGFEESITLSSDDIRKMIQEEIINIRNIKR